MPLPKRIPLSAVLDTLDPAKDIDGIHPVNAGLLTLGYEGFLPTTKSGSEAMASDETLKPFLEMLPNAKFYPTSNPAWNATDGAFKSLMGLLETQEPASVLEQIQAKAEAAG